MTTPPPTAQNTAHCQHLRCLHDLAGIPTGAGKEDRVINFIKDWVRQRDNLKLTSDAAGNLTISITNAAVSGRPPIYFTAHLDHPAFVIDRIIAPAVIEASFRGGVLPAYFIGARVHLHSAASSPSPPSPGIIVQREPGELFQRCIIELDAEPAHTPNVGDLLTWALPAPLVDKEGIFHAPACDDLAAAAAALCAMDVLRQHKTPPDARILFTLAEEVGFVGAIAACKLNTIPKGAQVLALENSRAFPDSPIGAGPIVRVGDRMSTFSPALNRAVASVALKLAGEEEKKVGQVADPAAKSNFNWQRKLMPGGACEATAFCAFGYDATCICLPLGAYHNMGDLDEVQQAVARNDPEESIKATIAPEFIAVEDFHNLIDLLIAAGANLDAAEPITKRMEQLYAERSFVLEKKK